MFHNIGKNQIKEIIHVAKCSMFFIDDNSKLNNSEKMFELITRTVEIKSKRRSSFWWKN
ncbi:MAG: hypothetical protein KHW82_14580 [Lachnospiraceae bacterium]|nr:hypothetical protein [Lachnospiraceae bacterium]